MDNYIGCFLSEHLLQHQDVHHKDMYLQFYFTKGYCNKIFYFMFFLIMLWERNLERVQIVSPKLS